MRNLVPVFLLLMISTSGTSQKPVELFEQAVDFYNDGELDSALFIFQKLYTKGKGDETLVAKAHYNMGDIFMEKKDYKNAKKVFMEILDANYNEMDEGGLGSGIMGEPYALYKNNCCKNLAKIALEEKDYKKALEYTELFNKVYPYRHFCGNEISANEIYVAYTYARCYLGLGDTLRAISSLLPECFYNPYASNQHVQEMAAKLICKQYNGIDVMQSLEQSIELISFREFGFGKNKNKRYYINFLQVEIQIKYWNEWPITPEDAAKIVKKYTEIDFVKYYLRQNDFFKLLNGNIQNSY